MSEGPISQWWKSHEPAKVSTPRSRATCYQKPGMSIAYCGRRLYASTTSPAGVTCADWVAAMRADGIQASPTEGNEGG